MSQIVDTLIEITRVESITGNEGPLCDLLETKLRDRFKSSKISPTFRRIGDSLVALGPFQKGRPTVTLAGHLDTVPGSNVREKVRLDNGKVYGLGTSDMKGGIAVMMELLKEDLLQSSPYNLIQVYYSCEEGDFASNGLHQVFPNTPELKETSLCFVLEPTDNVVHLGCIGSLICKVTFHGKSAHSARPWLGDNAIHKAARFLEKLSVLAPNPVKVGKLEFKEVISATMASGGVATNVIPEFFEVIVNSRFAPGTTPEEMKARISSLLNNDGELSVVYVCPSCGIPENNKLYDAFQEKYQLTELPKQAYTDVALFAQHGIPAINFGPGLTGQAHMTNEYINVVDLERSLQIYSNFLTERGR